MAYHLEGRLLEVCDCRVLCPCWIGEDPDNGTCDSAMAYHFDAGQIDGVDVTGRTIAFVCHIPGNVLQGNFRVAVYVDSGASDTQQEALLKAYTGQLGGPIADIAKLVGEVVSVERAPITFDVNEGRGTLRISDVTSADLEPYLGPDGSTTVSRQHGLLDRPGRAGLRRQGDALSLETPGTRPRSRHDRAQRVAKHVRV